jgi:hypothetical protein
LSKLGTFVSGAVLTAAELNAMGGALTSYTPTWTGITTGNGTNSGGWVQFGRLTYWQASFTFGTTSACTGAVTVSLPITLADANRLGSFSVKILDSGTAWYDCRLNPNSTTVASVEALNSAGTYLTGSSLSSTVPMTWTTSDRIEIACLSIAAS